MLYRVLLSARVYMCWMLFNRMFNTQTQHYKDIIGASIIIYVMAISWEIC